MSEFEASYIKPLPLFKSNNMKNRSKLSAEDRVFIDFSHIFYPTTSPHQYF